jgi:hypothetical protein
MTEARQLNGRIGDLDADQPAALRQVEGFKVGGVSEVSLRNPSRLLYWALRVNTKAAPKAWAVRNKVPTLMALLTPSTPTPK